jgi:DNA-binding NtrC family response regulator
MEHGCLSLLLVDDDEEELLIMRELLAEVDGLACELEWAASYDAGLTALGRATYDICLLDYRLGARTGLELLHAAIAQGCRVPIIMLTGQEDRDVDIAAMHAGASDYLVKGTIDPRLLERAVRYAIERKRAQEERERLIVQLQEALASVKALRGMLPICASCKKIRDDTGYWNQIESYIRAHADVEFSHGLCPDCTGRLYPDLFPDISQETKDYSGLHKE